MQPSHTTTKCKIFKKPVPYLQALNAMKNCVKSIQHGEEQEQIWFLEHPHVYTAGTSAQKKDLLCDNDFPIIWHAGRGGQWTYHGPGQRIIWVMLNLNRQHGLVRQRDIRSLVTHLEQWVIETLKDFHIPSKIIPKYPGIWVHDKTNNVSKIVSIGLRVSKWVSWHGLSININPNLHAFEGIVPCGIKEHGVTSVQALKEDVSMRSFDKHLIQNWTSIFGTSLSMF